MEQSTQQQQQQESCSVPPGFRFHPTEEELVGYYLTRKVASQNIDLDIIQEVDLYRIEPWDLQERCKYGGGGGGEEQTTTEWYFFSFKDRKYPSGTRTNRATAAGFWKATGRDKPVLSSSSSRSSQSRVIGMRKTLVFYKGRAPHGCKSDWIMHEYRLQTNEHAPTQEEGWVVCRAFQKPVPNQQRPFVFPPSYGGAAPGGYYDVLPRLHVHGSEHHYLAGGMSFLPPVHYSGDHQEMESKIKPPPYHHLLSIPQLESPSIGGADAGCLMAQNEDGRIQQLQGQEAAPAPATGIDWNFLDSLLSTSQLHDESLYLQ